MVLLSEDREAEIPSFPHEILNLSSNSHSPHKPLHKTLISHEELFAIQFNRTGNPNTNIANNRHFNKFHSPHL